MEPVTACVTIAAENAGLLRLSFPTFSPLESHFLAAAVVEPTGSAIIPFVPSIRERVTRDAVRIDPFLEDENEEEIIWLSESSPRFQWIHKFLGIYSEGKKYRRLFFKTAAFFSEIMMNSDMREEQMLLYRLRSILVSERKNRKINSNDLQRLLSWVNAPTGRERDDHVFLSALGETIPSSQLPPLFLQRIVHHHVERKNWASAYEAHRRAQNNETLFRELYGNALELKRLDKTAIMLPLAQTFFEDSPTLNRIGSYGGLELWTSPFDGTVYFKIIDEELLTLLDQADILHPMEEANVASWAYFIEMLPLPDILDIVIVAHQAILRVFGKEHAELWKALQRIPETSFRCLEIFWPQIIADLWPEMEASDYKYWVLPTPGFIMAIWPGYNSKSAIRDYWEFPDQWGFRLSTDTPDYQQHGRIVWRKAITRQNQLPKAA